MNDISGRVRNLRASLPAGTVAVRVAAFNEALNIIAILAAENDRYRERLIEHAIDVRQLAGRVYDVEVDVINLDKRTRPAAL